MRSHEGDARTKPNELQVQLYCTVNHEITVHGLELQVGTSNFFTGYVLGHIACCLVGNLFHYRVLFPRSHSIASATRLALMVTVR